MNALILVIYGKPAEDLFADDTLANLRRLMAMGAFGKVAPGQGDVSPAGLRLLEADVWHALTHSLKPGLWLASEEPEAQPPAMCEILATHWKTGIPEELSHRQFDHALAWMQNQEWGACLIEDHGLEFLGEKNSPNRYLQMLDEGMGLLFEALTDETLVAVLTRRVDALSGFILAAPFAEPVGEVKDAKMSDVAATLLHLCGLVSGDPTHGKLILRPSESVEKAGNSLSQDEEAILRERLSGLGYL